MNHSVYILYSADLNKYYVGHTSEPIQVRLKKHLSSHDGYTSRAKDWVLCYSESFETKTQAYRRELEIKKKKSRKYIEKLVNI